MVLVVEPGEEEHLGEQEDETCADEDHTREWRALFVAYLLSNWVELTLSLRN